jgi:microcystin degradation protein MlrC
MSFRIAIARLWHEGNSFTPVATRLADFRQREWHSGEAVPDCYRGRSGALRAIVTTSCQAPNDPEYLRLHGIELGALDLVCAKAKNHFRAAFGALCDPIIEVDTPGPAAANLAALAFRHLPPGLL